jgi:hypothetical protein
MRSAPANSHGTEGDAGAVDQSVPAEGSSDDALDPAGLLSEADALESDRRTRDAIDLLTEANRRCRNAQIEQRLVRLRHAAFAHLDQRQGLEDWPPDVEDLFSDSDPPPKSERPT